MQCNVCIIVCVCVHLSCLASSPVDVVAVDLPAFSAAFRRERCCMTFLTGGLKVSSEITIKPILLQKKNVCLCYIKKIRMHLNACLNTYLESAGGPLLKGRCCHLSCHLDVAREQSLVSPYGP